MSWRNALLAAAIRGIGAARVYALSKVAGTATREKAMEHAATCKPATMPHRPPPILAYANSDDGSPIEFEIEWSGYLQRWVIVDAYTDTLIKIHRDRATSN